jgi:hypothetical protein
MQNPGYGLRRITLPRTLVHKDDSGIKESRHPKNGRALCKRNEPLIQSLLLFIDLCGDC